VYLYASRQAASEHAEIVGARTGEAPAVVEAYVSIHHPKRYGSRDEGIRDVAGVVATIPGQDIEHYRGKLATEGYDGIIVGQGEGTEVVVFDPQQVMVVAEPDDAGLQHATQALSETRRSP
jgi:hypothetical protein